VTRLASQILGILKEMRVPLSVGDFKHQLGVDPAAVMIACYELEQAGLIKQRLRGVRQRPYYELVV
jgi:DNA-binding transcriptional regulator GbsR (MarR family)